MKVHPDVKNYLDVGQYLRDFYSYRKSCDAAFSYQTWAQELGFKNRSFLRLIVSGTRQITEPSRKLLLNGLNLEKLDRDYFELLVEYSQDRQPGRKTQIHAKLMAILRLAHDQAIVTDHVEFLSDPKISVLQTLLSFDDVDRTPSNLASALGCETGKIRDWLNLLARLGLAQENGVSGSWKATAKHFKIPENLGSQPLQGYHAAVLNRAIAANEMEPTDRRFRTLILPLSKHEYAELCEQINLFAARALSQHSHSELSGRKMHFFTCCLFPATSPRSLETPLAETDKAPATPKAETIA